MYTKSQNSKITGNLLKVRLNVWLEMCHDRRKS